MPTKKQMAAVSRGGKLTLRQKKLVQHYFAEAQGNQRAAALMAGYPPAMTKNIFQEFKKPAVVKEMARVADKMEGKFEVTYARLIEEMAKIAFFNMSDVMHFNEHTGALEGINLDEASMDAIAALGEVKIDVGYAGDGEEKQPVRQVTVKPYNKMDAIEKLIKHMGMSREAAKKVEHTHSLADRLRDGRARMNARLENKPIEGEFEVLGEGE